MVIFLPLSCVFVGVFASCLGFEKNEITWWRSAKIRFWEWNEFCCRSWWFCGLKSNLYATITIMGSRSLLGLISLSWWIPNVGLLWLFKSQVDHLITSFLICKCWAMLRNFMGLGYVYVVNRNGHCRLAASLSDNIQLMNHVLLNTKYLVMLRLYIVC